MQKKVNSDIGGLATQASRFGPPKVGGHLAPFPYSSREPSKLSQWLCHDDSTINIVVVIIIIIIIIIIITGTFSFLESTILSVGSLLVCRRCRTN